MSPWYGMEGCAVTAHNTIHLANERRATGSSRHVRITLTGQGAIHSACRVCRVR
jgi:hypothetical protein